MSHSRQAAAYLANIAYTDEAMDPLDYGQMKSDFTAALAAIPAGAQTQGPWTLDWGPALYDGLLLYVAKAADGSLAVVFRGTNMDGDARVVLENLSYDLNVVEQVPWQYPPSSGMYVSAGAAYSLSVAISALDPATTTTLLDHLRSTAKPGTDIMVTGHSLGGGLAVVGAAWLQNQLPMNGPTCTILPYSFAAPTIGDSNFAAFFPKAFPSYYAAVNTNDIVPMAWANVGAILESYAPDGPRMGWDEPVLWSALAGLDLLIPTYTAIVAPVPDTFTEVLGVFEQGALSAPSWQAVAGDMHSMRYTYLPHVDPEPAAPPRPVTGRRPVPRGRIRRQGSRAKV